MTVRFAIALLGLMLTGFPGKLSAGSIPSVRSPKLRSAAFLVKNQRTDELLLARRADSVMPIASITKLMTALVVLDARLDMDEFITIVEADKDTLRHSHSRLPVGTRLSRGDALRIALVASDNRAAHALGRTFPSGMEGIVQAMNMKAHALGLTGTKYEEPTGLSERNVSSALDLSRLADFAYRYPRIREFTTQEEVTIQHGKKRLHFKNTNPLVSSSKWDIGLSKTGYIEDSGQCLVMQAQMGGDPILVVLLDSSGKNSRIGDANRIRQWLESPKSSSQNRKK